MPVRNVTRNRKPVETVIKKNVVMGVKWRQDDLGSLRAKVFDYKLEAVNEDAAGTAWSEILLNGEIPKEIVVGIAKDTKCGVRLMHSTKWGGSREIAADKGVPHLKVPITWNRGRPKVTDKHDTEKRNICNLQYFNEGGAFMQVEISIVVRYGKLFLVIQELYAGQGALCSVAEAKAAGLQFEKLDGTDQVAVVLPLWGASAYPGADYLRTWPNTGGALLKVMHKSNLLQHHSDVQAAEWNPIDISSLGLDEPSGGRVRGWCTFFNVDSNYGFILLEDGSSVFVHFNALPRGMIALQGMEPYEFDLVPGQKSGSMQASNVQPIKVY